MRLICALRQRNYLQTGKIVREGFSPPAKCTIHSQRMEQAPSVRKYSDISYEIQDPMERFVGVSPQHTFYKPVTPGGLIPTYVLLKYGQRTVFL